MAHTQDPMSDLRPEVAERIRDYSPQCLDADSWALIADHSRDLVARSAPPTPKMAQDRLTTLCGLAASVPPHQRHDFDLLFSPAVRARHEARCGTTMRSLQQYRGRLNLLSDIHHGGYRPARRTAASTDPGPAHEGPLFGLLDDPATPECVVRLLVAGLGVGREGVEASRCRLEQGADGPVVVRTTGRSRPVIGGVRSRAEGLTEGPLLTGDDRGAALEWLAANGHDVPGSRSLSGAWLIRVITTAAPAASTIVRNALSRTELDRATALVADAAEDATDRVHLRG